MNSRKIGPTTHSCPLGADTSPASTHTPRHSDRSPDIIGTKRRSKIPRGNLLKLSCCRPNRPSCPNYQPFTPKPCKTNPIFSRAKPMQPLMSQRLTPISPSASPPKTNPIQTQSYAAPCTLHATRCTLHAIYKTNPIPKTQKPIQTLILQRVTAILCSAPLEKTNPIQSQFRPGSSPSKPNFSLAQIAALAQIPHKSSARPNTPAPHPILHSQPQEHIMIRMKGRRQML